MRFDSKFNIGDKVFISRRSTVQGCKDCEVCGGGGEITVKKTGAVRSCPKCYGRGDVADDPKTSYRVEGPRTVGKIAIEHVDSPGIVGEETFDNYKPFDSSTKETYMFVETGIGYGYVFNVDDMFALEDNAQAECDKRNKGKQKCDAVI